jgi:hypothetical protein
VCRYDAPALSAALGPHFALLRDTRETHLTPWGAAQAFTYAAFIHTA